MDIRLFHESGRRLIHKYRVYQDPLPHPALREGRITKLLSFVNRAMVIAQLTHLQIAIPSSGNPPGEVPSDCFPRMDEPGMTKTPKRVTFAPVIQTTTGEMDPPTMDQNETPTDSPMIAKQEETEEVRAHGIREESIVPPPGFRPFQWPQAEWEDIGDATLDPGLEFVASWSARIMEERSSPPPLIPLSPISAEDSQDYIMVQIGSPASELYTPAGLDRTRPVNWHRPRRPMKNISKSAKSRRRPKISSSETFCVTQQCLQTGLYRNPPEIKTAVGCHDGAWPGRDHSRTNDHRPLFESWAKVVLSDIRPTVWRTTLLQRVGLVSR